MSKDQIKKDNQRVLELMKNGESLKTVSVKSTWFPPRQKIEKDENALELEWRKKKGPKDPPTHLSIIR